ncbi:MAG: nitroreductase family protein [Acidiferrobacterales bacterium]
MTKPPETTKPESTMNLIDAIYHRRAVRHYTPRAVSAGAIRALLDAAVQAPTAVHEEPWAFAVIQDRNLLHRLSDSVKEAALRETGDPESAQETHPAQLLSQSDFNVFHDASTLIVIYGKFSGPFVVADCWLAAANLMLTAHARGLGTCVIGSSVPTLNMPSWKTEFQIPDTMTAVAPIIVGFPAGETPPVSRKPPEILAWK